jgi:4-alpha-glucanotransferase
MSRNLRTLAMAAGIEPDWRDASGKMQVVSDESLRAVLHALDLPAESEAQIRESQAVLRKQSLTIAPPLVTATINHPISLPGKPGPFRITLESGNIIEDTAKRGKTGMRLPPIQEPGYHRVEVNGSVTTIAVAPPRAYTLGDAGEGKKLWGLAVQLYALRRRNSGGIGDFAALAEFVSGAAPHGADAVAISPVHAQFAADVNRYGPYSASNRAALNVLFAPLDLPDTDDGDLINWPESATSRLRLLRENFENFSDHAALAEFRQQSGLALERHAIFEALSTKLTAGDFRTWPQEYQDPSSSAVTLFAQEHAREVEFHAWLQYLADRGLAAAQNAARRAGMKIGLITDLAVGTDPAGSHSWARQSEMLRGLEIGAPPDLFNAAGQNWGITVFSPRGLRQNGYSAFIEMLRHALRHAGGVRIDHVMGLARIWVIPSGQPCAQGAYLRLPADDLMRLVILESHRHKAVILGEDLGTLPPGFRKKLGTAGIAGMRVMWFERRGCHFKPPKLWTATATAMSTTHDLPTAAGWWQGVDIGWRKKIGMAGDSLKTRAADRAELWSAFRHSGAATAGAPAPENGAAAADAACAHLGHAACTLALLPIEDALALTEQPNLPGTINEHPNWRRRLPIDSQTIFTRPDVVSRLAALNKARKS